jgi:hypothetical protein
MASSMYPKASVSSSKSFSPPSYGDEVKNINNNIISLDDQAMDSIIVESVPLSPLPPPDGLSPPPPGQEDTPMRTATDEEEDEEEEGEEEDEVESMFDEEGDAAGDDEDDDEESEVLDSTVLQTEYSVPVKEPEEDHDSTRDVSENSLSVNGGTATTKIEFGESLTRGGKLRRLAPPPPVKHRKTPTGRSRTPRAPSPIIPPRNTSPWPDIQESDIRDEDDDDDRDTKRRRTTTTATTRQETNGTKESTPQPVTSRGLRRQGKEESIISVEERLKRSKRVKISPRKEKQQPNRQRSPPHPLTAASVRDEAVSGTATPRFIINMKPDKEDSDPTRYNEENCGACGGPGRFLCCEGCPKSFHFTCLDPPIDENDLPEDSWYASQISLY